MNAYQKFENDFKNKKVLILGLGLLGKGVKDTRFFAEAGADVVVSDLKTEAELKSSIEKLSDLDLQFVLGMHQKKDIENCDFVLRNPGVPISSPYLEYARKIGKPILMSDALFVKYFGRKNVIGITGTRGKTTTASLLYHILMESGEQVELSGNIPGKSALTLLKNIDPQTLVVMELSSWQLQGFASLKLSPHISVITTIYEDHLNRYPSMKKYIKDKKVIYRFQKQDDYLFLNKGFKVMQEFAKEANSQVVWFDKNVVSSNWERNLKGEHNRENIAAAVKTAEILGISKDNIKKAVANFHPVKHRLQKVADINGVEYINDTTSTTPAAGNAALRAIDKPIILIAGGASKNLDLSGFAKEVIKQVKGVILLKGTATKELKDLINKNTNKKIVWGEFDNFKKAVLFASKKAENGDVVLLSPGCASFGMFVNEFDRGNQFIKVVNELKNAQ